MARKLGITGFYRLIVKPWHRSTRDLQRARRIYRRIRQDPGDCAGDTLLLMALAVAESQVGRGPGWIPEVQRRACDWVQQIEANGA